MPLSFVLFLLPSYFNTMKLISLTLLSVSALSALVNASPLFDQLRIFTSTSETERRLVKYSEDSPARWMTEADKEALIRAGIKFMDITDYPSTSVNSFANWVPYIPTKVEYKDEVQPFIGNLTTETMKDVLTTFTSFRNRYYKSQYGAQSCRWLIEQIREIASGYDHVSVDEFEHNVSGRYCYTLSNDLISGTNSRLWLDLKVPTRILKMNWSLLVLIRTLLIRGFLTLVVHLVLM